jgi:hypothetical protein
MMPIGAFTKVEEGPVKSRGNRTNAGINQRKKRFEPSLYSFESAAGVGITFQIGVCGCSLYQAKGSRKDR